MQLGTSRLLHVRVKIKQILKYLPLPGHKLCFIDPSALLHSIFPCNISRCSYIRCTDGLLGAFVFVVKGNFEKN